MNIGCFYLLFILYLESDTNAVISLYLDQMHRCNIVCVNGHSVRLVFSMNLMPAHREFVLLRAIKRVCHLVNLIIVLLMNTLEGDHFSHDLVHLISFQKCPTQMILVMP